MVWKCLLSELRNERNESSINEKILELNTMIEESDPRELIFSIKKNYNQ